MDPNTSSGTPAPQKNNTMMFIIGIVVLLLVGAGIVFAMNRSNTQPAATQQEQPGSQSESTTETETPADEQAAMEEQSGEVKEFTVSGRNFSFTPNSLRVNEGDTVKITFTNAGGIHDFTLDEFDVQTAQIQGGQSEEVTFVANKAGTYEFYCSVGQHRQNGMKGSLIVE